VALMHNHCMRPSLATGQLVVKVRNALNIINDMIDLDIQIYISVRRELTGQYEIKIHYYQRFDVSDDTTNLLK
jgi:hypothetical protein